MPWKRASEATIRSEDPQAAVGKEEPGALPDRIRGFRRAADAFDRNLHEGDT